MGFCCGNQAGGHVTCLFLCGAAAGFELCALSQIKSIIGVAWPA